MPASPNPLNYFIGKGDLYWTPQGGIERHLGNAPLVQLQPNVTKLPHFSSRSGIATKDYEATQRKEATVTINVDEITIENLGLALFGEPEENSDGDQEFRIMASPTQTGRLRLVGANDVGNRFLVIIDRVSINPSEPIDFISEEYSVIAIEGECTEVVAGQGFGSISESRDAPTT